VQIAIVDTGPLLAAVDIRDPRFDTAQNVLQMGGIVPIVPALVAGEVTYMVGRLHGPAVEAAFLRGLAEMDVRAPLAEDWRRIGDLVQQYRDFPLGGVDASVIALAERLGTDVVITFDRRHFTAVRPRHCDAFEILPSA
jgi:uncharacterized protein